MRRLGMWLLVALGIVLLAGFGTWRWAVSNGSAATLDWIDARFSRDTDIALVVDGTYGSHPAQRGEIWAPATGKSRGLVVFIHGGGWHSGAPEEYRFVARTLGNAGYTTALLGYRLVPDGRFPAMLEDSAAGIAWARETLGTAAEGMVLAGHSAGAYNVLMLGLDPQWLAAAGVPENAVAGVISMAGPTDFHPFTSDSAENALGHVEDPASTQPITFARGDAAPILLMHGTADTVVRPYNSERLTEAVTSAGGRAEIVTYPDMGHAGIIMGLSRPFAQGGVVVDPILAFLEKVTGRGGEARITSSVPVQRETR